MKKVIFSFSFPHSIITNNGTNLSKGDMEEFCRRENIRLDVSSVAHPQSNGQAERAKQEIDNQAGELSFLVIKTSAIPTQLDVGFYLHRKGPN